VHRSLGTTCRRNRSGLAGFVALAVAALLALGAAAPRDARAEERGQPTFPRLANIYFGTLTGADLERLARWDVLVVCRRGQDAWANEIATLRRLNPDIIIVAHCPIGYHGDWTWPPIEGDIRDELNAQGWWMTDTAGGRVHVPGGDDLLLNLTVDCPRDPQGRRLCDWLAEFIAERLGPGGLWDGVYLDFCMDDISWLNSYLPTPIDSNGDGIADGATALNTAWREGTGILAARLRALVGDDYVMCTNGNNTHYEDCNGSTRENFPWMHGDWYQNIANPTYGYTAIETRYRAPRVNIINSIWEGEVNPNGPVRTAAFERKFGLAFASTLVFGNGYFSLDGGWGLPPHSQMWWHEYYDIDLGAALGRAEVAPAEPGALPNIEHADMIRIRHFEHGVAVVNPTSCEQTVELGGCYYDAAAWNGVFYPESAATTRISMEARSGAVLVGSGHVVDCGARLGEGSCAPYGGGTITVAWEPITGAIAYSVYRSTGRASGAATPRMLVGVVSIPSFVDGRVRAGAVYNYFIAPIGEDRCEGRSAPPIQVSTWLGIDTHMAISVEDLDGLLVLTWSPPDIPDDLLFDIVRSDGTGERATLTGVPLSSASPGRFVDVSCRPGAAYTYELVAASSGDVLASVSAAPPDAAVLRTRLRGSWPQPTSGSAVIAFDVGEDERWAGGAPTSLVVYDASGRVVRRLLTERLPSGSHSVEWDGRSDRGEDVASGCYFYVLTVGDESRTGKALVVR
jgi:hypothetical protein